MDPVSHLMLGGRMAALVPRERRPRGTITAFVVGSVVPDADIVLAPRWSDTYFLQVHPAISHASIWTPLEALVSAVLLKAVVRRTPYVTLALASWIAALGHVLSDFADGSDIS